MRTSSLFATLAFFLVGVYSLSAQQCDGTIAFRRSSGTVSVFVSSGTTASYPTDIGITGCSSALYARGDEFCCALDSQLGVACADWTPAVSGAALTVETWTVPSDHGLVWPPNRLLLTYTGSKVFISLEGRENHSVIGATNWNRTVVLNRKSDFTTSVVNPAAEGSEALISSPEDHPLWISNPLASEGGAWTGFNATDDSLHPWLSGIAQGTGSANAWALSSTLIWTASPANNQLLSTPIIAPSPPLPTVWNTAATATGTFTSIASTDLSCPHILASTSDPGNLFRLAFYTSAGFAGNTLVTSSDRITYIAYSRFLGSVFASPPSPIPTPAPSAIAPTPRGEAPVPLEPLEPSAQVPSSVEPPSLPCRGPKPHPSFICENGTWVSPTSVYNGTIIVTGTVLVFGNITIQSTTISGLHSTLVITNCASISGDITLVLSPAELEEIIKKGTAQTPLITSSNCSLSNLASVPIKISYNGKKRCEKVSITSKIANQGKTLSAVVSVDKSPCRLWWIILASVLAGVLLLAVIILVLVFTLSPAARHAVRPFSRRKHAPANPK